MANDLYRTYEVLVEESIRPDHPKRAQDRTSKPDRFNAEIDGALRDTHMIFQDAVCYNTLLLAGLAGKTELPPAPGERAQLLNPLWNYLTTPKAQGGIREETEKVIRRLAAHYQPLAGVTNVEEFLNRVYSEPLQICPDMSEEKRAEATRIRALTYRLLEKFGVTRKEKGKRECADMAEFKNNWAGLMSDPESDAKIPGNGAYDRIWRELQKPLTNANSDGEAFEILEKALNRYSEAAEKQNQAHCERDYQAELEKRQKAVAETEKRPDSDIKKPAALKRAKAALQKLKTGKAKHDQEFLAERRKKLEAGAVKAFSKPFVAQNGSDIGLTEDEFRKAKTRVVNIGASLAASPKPLIRLHYKSGATGNFEKAMFRYWVLRHNEDQVIRRAALADFRKFIIDEHPKEEPKLDGKPMAEMPFVTAGAKFAFLPFGKKALQIATSASSPTLELDKAAFAAAAEDVFKYMIRTGERARKVADHRMIFGAYEGKGLGAEHSPTGKNILGMSGDPRWKEDGAERKGIVDLLTGLTDDKDIAAYGLRESTIGGRADVRKALLQTYDQAKQEGWSSDDTRLSKQLETAVDNEMEANRQGFGSADFFHELCDPEFHHLWMRGPEYEHNGIGDFIPHFVRYCEYREELVDLLLGESGAPLDAAGQLTSQQLAALAERPISYTWPGLLNRHKKPSYRYYDFAGNLNTAFQFKVLLRRVRSKDAPTCVDRYERLPEERAKLTLAARRLKRDKIINKGKEPGVWSSVDALWCPPLILAGEANPTADTKPRAGKEKKKPTDEAEVSFSLIASPLPDDFWNAVADVRSSKEAEPVHLSVSFKIEGDELAKLRAETKQWTAGSHRGAAKLGEKDDKRRHFKWPIDLETSRFESENAEEKPKELWCGKGQIGSDWKGFTFRYDGKKTTYQEPFFDILSIDLGNRFAAAFARLRIHADANGKGRVISADPFFPVIKADVAREGTMRLQGESAEVWQLVTEKNRKHIARQLKSRHENREPVVGTYEWVEEKFGNGGRGRFPTADEFAAFSRLAARLVPVESLTLAGKESETYPELGDHLIFRLKRRIGRLRTLFNLVWRLAGDKEKDRAGRYTLPRMPEKRPEHWRAVIETLARSAFPKQERQPGETEDRDDQSLRLTLAGQEQWEAWCPLLEKKKGKEDQARRKDLEVVAEKYALAKWLELEDAVKKQITDYCTGTGALDHLLVEIIEFCLPLRGRHWQWAYNQNGDRLAWGRNDVSHVPRIEGMRGLSLKRLEQILNLQQRCQSFAKLETRFHEQFRRPTKPDYNPPDSKPREDIDDVCPLLLERSNRIREQRVDQIAHLILTEALGMKLKNPTDVENKKQRKSEVDLHGEYQRRMNKQGNPYPRCSVIVLENLERYKTSQERTRSENSRLMQWAHRAIIEKLEDMCRPFGITLMLVDPAFSSRFDGRTGLPGVRAVEVSRNFHNAFPYLKWATEKTKKGEPTRLANDIETIKAHFAANQSYQGTFLLAVEGGKEFLPVVAPNGGEGLVNADINAAVNIGLRAIADPQRLDIFPRLWTRRFSDTEVRVTSWRGWFGRFAKNADERTMRAVSASQGGAVAATTPKGKLAKKKDKRAGLEPADRDASDSVSSQSSENPPFFIEPTSSGWLSYLANDAFVFRQGDKEVRAYPQGKFLKRVEGVCAERIQEINRTRIEKWERANDDVTM